MEKGIFYSVGIGPGDPDLITIKAIENIKSSDIIALPDSGAKENLAFKISEKFLKDKKVIYIEMPMIRDKEKFSLYHKKAVDKIKSYLDCNKSVSFLTLGDPTIYSTPMYIHKKLKNEAYITKIIPGVTSFCAAASSLDVSLVEGSEPLFIIPASYEGTSELLKLRGNKILMKSGKKLEEVLEYYKTSNDTVMMVENATLENEKIYYSVDEIDKSAGYFSVVVVKEENLE